MRRQKEGLRNEILLPGQNHRKVKTRKNQRAGRCIEKELPEKL
jgi:hypothetical protein